MAATIALVVERVPRLQTTNQAICKISNDRHQQLLEVDDVRSARGWPGAMNDFVERIKQMDDQILRRAKLLIPPNDLNKQTKLLEFICCEGWLVRLATAIPSGDDTNTSL